MPRRLLLGIVALTGCAPSFLGEDKSQLPLLRDDPVAAKDLLGLPLLEEYEQGFSRPLGKPSYTRVRRVFRVDEAKTREVFDAACQFAKSAGWEDDSSSPHVERTFWLGEKTNPTRTCKVSARDDQPAQLRVTLTVNKEP